MTSLYYTTAETVQLVPLDLMIFTRRCILVAIVSSVSIDTELQICTNEFNSLLIESIMKSRKCFKTFYAMGIESAVVFDTVCSIVS